MSEHHPTFESLQLLPGQPMQLEIDGFIRERDRATLIGYRPGKSIIITTPTVRDHPISIKLETGLNVRFFANRVNGACAFRSQVIHVSTLPFPHLHLAMPDELFVGEVRKAVRARVAIGATLVFEGERSSAELVDLSTDGGRLRTRAQAIEAGDELSVITKLKLGPIEKVVRLLGVARSVVLDDDRGTITIGLQWRDVDENEAIALQAYVQSRLNDNPH